MKKIFLVLFLLSSSVCFSQERLTENEKIVCIFTGTAKVFLSDWGFRQKSAYGTTTGIIFALGAFRDFYDALKYEGR